ncbi:hypothetical protein A3731_21940 [Roseovarius sp. HI0049]|nr:hypothetical protein A3731_21940 [Roseovarius sp. HI0049]
MAVALAISSVGEAAYAQSGEQTNWAQLCMGSAADQDMPAYYLYIARENLGRVVDGRVELPDPQTWYVEPSPRAIYTMASPFPDGAFEPLNWEELASEDGIDICERALQQDIGHNEPYVHMALGRLLHRSGQAGQAVAKWQSVIDEYAGMTNKGAKSIALSIAVPATYIARQYETGEGVKQDLARAAELNTVAAVTARHVMIDDGRYWPGHSRAMHNLASQYYWGAGVESLPEKAGELWESAAQHWQVHSIANLAWLKRRGIGVAADGSEAANLYLKALRLFSLQHEAPELLVGNDNRFGTFKPDEAITIGWLEGAANAGQREALFTLGYLHHSGTIGTPDLENALDYYERAVPLYGASPEYSAGPAFVRAHGAAVPSAPAAWALTDELLDKALASTDPIGLAFAGKALERRAEQADADPELLRRAFNAYSASNLPNAKARAADLLIRGASNPEGQIMPREEAMRSAIALLRPAAEAGNASAQFDLGNLLIELGDSEGLGWLEKSTAGVEDDFLHPDIRPLFMGSVVVDDNSEIGRHSQAIYFAEEAQRRAIYQGQHQLLPEALTARQDAYDQYKLALDNKVRKRERQAREAARSFLRALAEGVARNIRAGGGDLPGRYPPKGQSHNGRWWCYTDFLDVKNIENPTICRYPDGREYAIGMLHPCYRVDGWCRR